MRFASLGSGSEGNALLVEAGSGASRTRALLDCGFSVRETERRLARLGCAPDDLHALIVTHEHADHIGSAYGFAAKYQIPLYLSHGTHRVTSPPVGIQDLVRFCSADCAFEIGGLLVTPYTVPHDAQEPLQFVFSDGNVRFGVLTDAGMATPSLMAHLSGLNALMLECNHDKLMLQQSAYPQKLKSRIGGDFGHLANDVAAEILAGIWHPRLSRIVAAHLSKRTNHPSLAMKALKQVLGDDCKALVRIADQENGLDWEFVQR